MFSPSYLLAPAAANKLANTACPSAVGWGASLGRYTKGCDTLRQARNGDSEDGFALYRRRNRVCADWTEVPNASATSAQVSP